MKNEPSTKESRVHIQVGYQARPPAAPLPTRSHGSAYLRLLPLWMRTEGAPVVAIDPTAANIRAVSAYKNAGFQIVPAFANHEGRGVLMLFE